jgi:hypothetical protein
MNNNKNSRAKHCIYFKWKKLRVAWGFGESRKGAVELKLPGPLLSRSLPLGFLCMYTGSCWENVILIWYNFTWSSSRTVPFYLKCVSLHNNLKRNLKIYVTEISKFSAFISNNFRYNEYLKNTCKQNLSMKFNIRSVISFATNERIWKTSGPNNFILFISWNPYLRRWTEQVRAAVRL